MERGRDKEIKHLPESNTICPPPHTTTLKQKNMYTNKSYGHSKISASTHSPAENVYGKSARFQNVFERNNAYFITELQEISPSYELAGVCAWTNYGSLCKNTRGRKVVSQDVSVGEEIVLWYGDHRSVIHVQSHFFPETDNLHRNLQ
jgi:hypothetical protein